MVKLIPQQILDIYKKVEKANFQVYLVGGCVRNLLLKRPVKDWDMTTNAAPQNLLKIFKEGFYDNKFGTVGIPVILGRSEATTPESDPGQARMTQKIIVEITTFRTEQGFFDSRHPEKVSWGKSIEEDLARRDFTINAIAMKLSTFNSQLSTNLVDPYDGQKDIKNKIIRAVGNPKARFKEDALRLLRAVRIATELSFAIEEKTWREVIADAQLIKKVSGERIRVELLRILASDKAYEGVLLLQKSDLLNYILPELMEGVGVSQKRPGRHHTDDVFTHNVLSMKFCPSLDPIIKLAALLHDVGKPKVMSKDEEGLVIFYNHEVAGTNIAREICDRLKFSKKERNKIVNLIRWHMFTVDEKLSDAGIRRFIRRIGVENVKDMMDIRIGDRLGGGTQTAESWRLKLFKKRIEEQLKPLPFSINDLAIDGNDIIKELSIKPGPKIGEILNKLFLEVDEDLSKNTKEYLIKRIRTVDK
ncbi:MAG: CCA tRNA nucleotidyltransferase [Candidatus Levybacteria bacterium]|nr:CCA tRNA nucleotidyltransferase [Candidatus Levybacteria bacterium]